MLALYLLSLFVFPLTYAWPRPEAKELIEKRGTIWRGQIEYVGCDTIHPRMVDWIQGHIRDAELLAAEAYKYAEKGNKYYDAFFGVAPNNRFQPNDEDMRERFRTLAKIETTPSNRNPSGYHIIRCDFENQPDARCSGGNLAPMMTEMKTGIIWACRAFLRGGTKLKDISPPIPQHGYRSLDGYAPHGGLILHEFAHSVFEVVDANVTIGNSKVPMYGHKRSLLGVQQKGARSGRINADSYRMFATATYWNSTTGTPWSIDPNNIGTGELR